VSRPLSAPTEVPLRCSCGVVRGAARGVSGANGNRLICYCDDCQSFAHFLGPAQPILDSHGGTEIFQMSVLEPRLAILDETDSGLDIDAMKIVADGVNALRSDDRAFVLITHYQRLLDYVEPDYVHVLANGRIVKSGDKDLALSLEKRGYEWVLEAAQ
jgi:hypothetical protein